MAGGPRRGHRDPFRAPCGILCGVPHRLTQLAAVLAALAALPIGPAGAAVPSQPVATRLVAVGPGPVENSVHPVVRTPDGRVYVVTADDGALFSGTRARLRMFEGDQVGSPTSFTERDAGGAPGLDRREPFRN